MNKVLVKYLLVSAAAMGVVCGCSNSNGSSDSSNPEESSALADSIAVKNDANEMWACINRQGVSDYFDSLSHRGRTPVMSEVSHENSLCAAPALSMDDHTRYLDELETLFDEGELVEGVCGKALKLHDGQVAPLGINLIDSMSVGTAEFWFRPNDDFYNRDARTLLGNDGARIHFFYKDGELYFQKNHADQHFFVNGSATLKDGWNLIAGQWGDGYMSVWLNGELIARKAHTMGYAPAMRDVPFENLVVIGYKSECCMEGPGQYESMTTSGSFDQFRISNVTRYLNPVDADTSKMDTVVLYRDSIYPNVDPVVVDTLVSDTSLTDEDSAVVDTLIVDNDTVIVDSSKGILLEDVCNSEILYRDENTLYMDELDSLEGDGELIDGFCGGKAISLKDGDIVTTGIDMVDSIDAGTVEFWFRPDSNFYSQSARTLLGNDDSRMHFFYKAGQLYFQKNHPDQHFYVNGTVAFKDGWNLVAGQWGDGYMSIWLNGELVARKAHFEGYAPSSRGATKNLVVIGYKSSCCMEGPGQYSSMTTSGAFDQLRISKVTRYDNTNN